MSRLNCFKTYDVRGRIPEDLNPPLAYNLGCAFAQVMQPGTVALGYDMRLSSPELARAVGEGLRSQGVDVYELGLCGTEEVYFATFKQQLGGGIMVTASHNPADYNGMKMVGRRARPTSQEQLDKIEELTREGFPAGAELVGSSQPLDCRDAYLDLLEKLVPPDSLGELRILANAGNGSIAPLLARIQERYQLNLDLIQGEPDGTFPNGVPNPLLPENRGLTSQAVLDRKADLGVAWDGDFDRCFFFDETGQFVESYYLIGILAEDYLARHPGSIVLYDPRLTWNTEEVVAAHGGLAQICQTGHVFFKRAMADQGAVYGGEMSGHHYFEDFGGCDTGVLPWMLLMGILARSQQKLSQLVSQGQERYPISGEINRSVSDPAAALQAVREFYAGCFVTESDLDGVSLEFSDWRFNLRLSNTEPLVRLNVESRGSRELVEAKTAEILQLLA